MGGAESLSGWVNHALSDYVERERRLRAMADAVAAYEAEFGEISAGEIVGRSDPIAKLRLSCVVSAESQLARDDARARCQRPDRS